MLLLLLLRKPAAWFPEPTILARVSQLPPDPRPAGGSAPPCQLLRAPPYQLCQPAARSPRLPAGCSALPPAPPGAETLPAQTHGEQGGPQPRGGGRRRTRHAQAIPGNIPPVRREIEANLLDDQSPSPDDGPVGIPGIQEENETVRIQELPKLPHRIIRERPSRGSPGAQLEGRGGGGTHILLQPSLYMQTCLLRCRGQIQEGKQREQGTTKRPDKLDRSTEQRGHRTPGQLAHRPTGQLENSQAAQSSSGSVVQFSSCPVVRRTGQLRKWLLG